LIFSGYLVLSQRKFRETSWDNSKDWRGRPKARLLRHAWYIVEWRGTSYFPEFTILLNVINLLKFLFDCLLVKRIRISWQSIDLRTLPKMFLIAEITKKTSPTSSRTTFSKK
jgi:hypothetical protein